ncbi:MAG: C39 family peptidase [Caldilineaceae bacterium]|nr:C39 family peptidase [Caldilineaceae bacterium]
MAACASMILSYLGIQHQYPALVSMLNIKPEVGTPFSSIHNLARMGVRVIAQKQGQFETLYRLLASGWPVIAAVQTRELTHWKGVESQHTVTVIGMTADEIFINDPDFAEHPLPVSYGDFDLAWLEMNERFAVIGPSVLHRD